MQKILKYVVGPEIAFDQDALESFLKKKTGLDQFHFRKYRQSIDARGKAVKVNLEVEISTDGPFQPLDFPEYQYKSGPFKKKLIIIGAGPAGLFAALRCLELQIQPIILERGKDVRARRRDLAAINKEHIVNPDSNYCFGEGGAGTYSDGKLYTRSKKRGDIRRILEIFVKHGATERILVETHPHIGTNKLPVVIGNIRNTILQNSGEIHFDTKVTDFLFENGQIKGVISQGDKTWQADGVILATGHSARDIFELLHQKGLALENKPFALGVRVEHAQKFVDSCQYHTPQRGLLPAAAYSLVEQTNFEGVQRGVFSFCMCPGGFIVPASTAPGELVVNGMSPSRRDSYFANSGVVVAIDERDWAPYLEKYGPLSALQYQKVIEQRAHQLVIEKSGAEYSQAAPAQKIKDFYSGKVSKDLNETSYQPGLIPLDFHHILPKPIAGALKQGLKGFNRKMKNYELGQMIGIESRTSSPVRIPRTEEDLEHPEVQRFYPCGEGAGYAGGIVSAAVDGERCVNAFAKKYLEKY
ncbi:NAD(P)/FAD-dependent oxidoreductase [Leadbetterella byssophila]|uniref:NAD(P)/FAD-dependent oxidoreductase n=1 Tax=Leadbetterella byssophila TaxID=316068 RepID=UPI0039A341C6